MVDKFPPLIIVEIIFLSNFRLLLLLLFNNNLLLSNNKLFSINGVVNFLYKVGLNTFKENWRLSKIGSRFNNFESKLLFIWLILFNVLTSNFLIIGEGKFLIFIISFLITL